MQQEMQPTILSRENSAVEHAAQTSQAEQHLGSPTGPELPDEAQEVSESGDEAIREQTGLVWIDRNGELPSQQKHNGSDRDQWNEQ